MAEEIVCKGCEVPFEGVKEEAARCMTCGEIFCTDCIEGHLLEFHPELVAYGNIDNGELVVRFKVGK